MDDQYLNLIDELSHGPILTTDYRHPLTITRQKENGYEGSLPSTKEERAKRFFANGKYASGKFKKWIEEGGSYERF